MHEPQASVLEGRMLVEDAPVHEVADHIGSFLFCHPGQALGIRAGELAAENRGGVHVPSSGPGKPVDAIGNDPLHRIGDAHPYRTVRLEPGETSRFRKRAHELDGEEGISFGELIHHLGNAADRGEIGIHGASDANRGVEVQGREDQQSGTIGGNRPIAFRLSELGPARAHEQRGHTTGGAGADEFDQLGSGPMHVLEDEHLGVMSGDGGEEHAPRRRELSLCSTGR